MKIQDSAQSSISISSSCLATRHGSHESSRVCVKVYQPDDKFHWHNATVLFILQVI